MATYLGKSIQNLKRFYKPGEEVESSWIAIDQMVSDLGVLPQVLCVERQEIEAQSSHEELMQGDNSYKAMWQSMIQRDALVST